MADLSRALRQAIVAARVDLELSHLLLIDALILLLMVLPSLVLIGLVIYSAHPSVRRTWREAEGRAEVLVRSVLSEDEYQRLSRDGYIDVPSPAFPQRIYRIPSRRGTVMVLEAGHCIGRLCAYSTEPIPDPETVVVHKLMIEGNEMDYLRVANHIPC